MGFTIGGDTEKLAKSRHAGGRLECLVSREEKDDSCIASLEKKFHRTFEETCRPSRNDGGEICRKGSEFQVDGGSCRTYAVFGRCTTPGLDATRPCVGEWAPTTAGVRTTGHVTRTR